MMMPPDPDPDLRLMRMPDGCFATGIRINGAAIPDGHGGLAPAIIIEHTCDDDEHPPLIFVTADPAAFDLFLERILVSHQTAKRLAAL